MHPSPTARRALLTRALAVLAAGAVLVLGTACGGGTDRTKAQLRLVNASSGYATLDLRVKDQLRQGGVAYGQAQGYVDIDPGEADSTLTSAGSATALLSFTPSLAKDRFHTLLAYGPAGALRQMVLDDNVREPDVNRALLRVVNAAPDAGALDVYVTAAGDSLATAVPLTTRAAYGSATAPINLASGTWRVRVTAADSKTDVRLDIPALSLPSRHIATLVLTPTAGGALVNALVLAQQGAIAREDVREARVRLAAGVTASGTVAAQLGGVVLSAGTGSPALGEYRLVPAGTVPMAVTVNGVAAGPSSTALVAGRDHTLLAYGPAGSPVVALIADDNTLPADGTRAKMRLVNGLADSAAPLSMTLDFNPVAAGVLPGTASTPESVAPTSGTGNGVVSVTGAGLPAALFTAANQQVVAGGVYTVLLMGPVAAPAGIVRRDR